MIKQQYLLIFFTILCVCACSSSESRRQASGGFEYLNKDIGADLKVPENLDSPTVDPMYAIPGGLPTASNPFVGNKVDVASPRLVIPLVSGSYIEEGSKDAMVLFDKVDDSKPLDRTIWDKVLAYLEVNQIGVDKFDQENNVLVTDWVIDKKLLDSAWYDFTDDFIEHSKKFKLTLELAPHGRTAKLTSELVEYIDEKGNSVISSLFDQQRREDEVDFLNFIIAEYDFGLRLEQSARIAEIKRGFNSDMGFNSDGDPALVVDASYANSWPRIQLVLAEMGFVVVDLDQSAGIIFANYVGNTSWFAGLFGSNTLDLAEGDYRLSIEAVGDKTAVTFKQADDTTFSVDQVVALYPVFSELMADSSLEF